MATRLMAFLLVAAAWALPHRAASAPLVALNGFAGTCGDVLVCAGVAAEQGATLRLVPAVEEQAGAAWLAAPIALSAGQGFVASFTFRFGASAAARADGIAFVLAADPSGLGDAGRYGDSMGFEGIGRSLAVEFDVFDNGGEVGGSNHVALDRNGTMSNLGAASPFGQSFCEGGTVGAHCMSNGDVWTAIIAYDGQDKALSVAVRDGAGNTDLVIDRYGLDLGDLLGGTSAYAGFGAGTGLGRMDHDLLSWTMSLGTPRLADRAPDTWMTTAQESQLALTAVPEPRTTTMLALGMIALAEVVRRR